MTTNTLTAGNANAPAALLGGNDGTLNLIVGPVGSQVTALSIDTTGNATFSGRGGLQLGTKQVTTSGTAIDFTGIPSWAKRITVNLFGVSTSGTSNFLVQFGTAGSIETTGYLAGAVLLATGITQSGYTTGFGIPTAAASNNLYGAITFTLQDPTANSWDATGILNSVAGALVCVLSGGKSLASTLTRVRLTALNGTDTFTAGSANILYEG